MVPFCVGTNWHVCFLGWMAAYFVFQWKCSNGILDKRSHAGLHSSWRLNPREKSACTCMYIKIWIISNLRNTNLGKSFGHLGTDIMK